MRLKYYLFYFRVIINGLVLATRISGGVTLNSEGAILVEVSTGKILFEKNADDTLHPASMSKLMTEYLVLEAIGQHKLAWPQTVTVSDYAAAIATTRVLSNVPLYKGESYTIRELYEAMVIFSANGATIALAEAVAGTETEFIRRMNAKAAGLGLTHTHFFNCTGLNNKDLKGQHPAGTEAMAENIMSARDCARLAFHLLTDYPEIVETSGRARQDFRPGKREFTAMRNWDWMLAGFPYAYPGTDGLKTGSTKLAGCNFTGTARRDGIRLLSVVMKASSYRTRFTDTRQLFDYGFSVLRRVPGLPPGFSDNGQAVLKVAKGSQETVRISARQAPDRLAGEGGEGLVEAVFKILPDLKAAENTVWAPLALDQVVGHITFSQQPDAVPGYIVPDSCLTLGAIAVVAQEEVGRTGFWYRIGRALGRGWERIIQWLVDKIMEMYKVITLRENRDGMETDHIMVVLGRDLAGGG